MSATPSLHSLALPTALSLPHCCVGCYVEVGQELPDACILEPCARHQRSDGGKSRRPTAVGDPAPDDLPCNDLSTEALAERGSYLLDYGFDVIARLTHVDIVNTAQLSIDLKALGRVLSTAAHVHEVARLREIVRRIDEALTLAEMVLQDAEDREDPAS